MRLFELINFDPVNTNKNYKTRSNRVADTTKSTVKGTGHFAKVNQHDSPKRLNQVRKTGQAGKIGYNEPSPVDDPSKDAYLSYIKMVVEDKSQNPYFPRVHNVQTFRAPNGDIYYNVDLEKLLPFRTEKIYDNEALTDSLRERMFKFDDTNPNDDFGGYSLSQQMMYACEADTNRIRDPKLLDAVQKINSLIEKSDHHWDMGSANMMWRLTGNMPQIVLTDPVA